MLKLSKNRLATLLLLSLVALFSMPARAAGDVTHKSVQGGEILNCFLWKYSEIKEMIPRISGQKFSAIQVTSVQPLPKTGCFKDRFFPDIEHTAIPDYYRIYAPLDLRLIAAADDSTYTPLGTRAELEELISAAHAAGLAVVVGVEANQVYDTASTSATYGSVPAGIATRGNYDTNGIGNDAKTKAFNFVNKQYASMDGTLDPFNDPTRKKFTEKTLNPAVLDVNTENADVINKMKTFIGDLYKIGVDGICWYHAKYIGVKHGLTFSDSTIGLEGLTNYKAEGSDFWPSMLAKNAELVGATVDTNTERVKKNGSEVSPAMFFYGNLNLDPFFKGEIFKYGNSAPQIDHDPNHFGNNITEDHVDFRTFREYTRYMHVVDAWYGKSSMMQDGVSYAAGNWINLQGAQKYTKGWTSQSFDGFYVANPSDMVYIAEDENTYLNNPEWMYEPMLTNNIYHENRPTSSYSVDVADRSYANMAGHDQSTIVYFARPNSDPSKLILGGNIDGKAASPHCFYEDVNNWTKTSDGTDGLSKLYVYYWGKNITDKQATAWPGTQKDFKIVGKRNGHNVVMWSVPITNMPDFVIFNNGMATGSSYDKGTQTKNLSFNNDRFYNREGVYNYCYFEDTKDWTGAADTNPDTTKLRAHFWTTGGKLSTNWPGPSPSDSAAFKYIGDNNGHHVYEWHYTNFTIPIDYIIFNNNNNGKQTGNLDFVVGGYYTADGLQAGANAPAEIIHGTDTTLIATFPASLSDVSTRSHYYTSTVIPKVNLFHQRLRGESEYKEAVYNGDGKNADIAAIARPDGAIIVMRNPATNAGDHTIINPNHIFSPGNNTDEFGKGTYTDKVTGATFNVSTSTINGPIGKQGIAILYDENNVKMLEDTSTIYVNVSPVNGSSSNGTIAITVEPKGENTGWYIRYSTQQNMNSRNSESLGSVSKPFSGKQTITFDPLTSRKLKATFQRNQEITVHFKIVYFDKTNSKVSRSEMRTYTIYNNNTAVAYHFVHHLLYFRLPEKVIGRLTLYAWDDEGGKAYPLTKRGGDTLAVEKADPKDYRRPIDDIYKYTPVYPGDKGDVDDQYLNFVGDYDQPAANITDSTNENLYPGYDGKYTYSLDHGISYNDVVNLGGNKVNRYCVGMPNLRFDNIKLRLSYHKENGFTQQLDVMECNDDAYYDVHEDKEGNLGIGKMFAIIGDALLDNRTWRYYTPEAGSKMKNLDSTKTAGGNTYWDESKDSNGNAIKRVTLMDYDPDETKDLNNELSKVGGDVAQVSTYTGEFVHGGTFRFGYPFDMQTSLVPMTNEEAWYVQMQTDTTIATKDDGTTGKNVPVKMEKSTDVEEAKAADGKDRSDGMPLKENFYWKGYLKAVNTTFQQEDYNRASELQVNSYDSYKSWMQRGAFAKEVKDSSFVATGNFTFDESSRKPTTEHVTCPNITWQLPSGEYTVRLYEITQKEGQSYYYYTINRPSIVRDSLRDYHAALDAKDSKTSYFNLHNDETNPYYYIDSYVGHTGWTGTRIKIRNNVKDSEKYDPADYTLEERVGSGSDVSSNVPETGRYRVVYYPGHRGKGFDPSINDSVEVATATHSKAKYYLGFKVGYYPRSSVDAAKGTGIENTGTSSTEPAETDFPGGMWRNYSDGLPRVKPTGVHAYYCQGYYRNPEKKNRVTIFLKEFKGSELPPYTGLILYYPWSVFKHSTGDDAFNHGYENPEATTSAGRGGKYLYVEAGGNSSNKSSIGDNTNYLVPLVACIDSLRPDAPDTRWAELPSVKQPDALWDNYWMEYKVPKDSTNGKSVLAFYGIGHMDDNFEMRSCFVSIPKNSNIGGTVGYDDDDVIFGAPADGSSPAPKKTINRNPTYQQLVDDADVIFSFDPNVSTDVQVQKFIVDGEDKTPYYDLSGRMVQHPTRGVYIHGGKKIVIK